MLGFPAATEIKKLITKKKVYEHFAAEMNTERRKSFDADIARITLVNEISPASLNIADGTQVHTFFVVAVTLRKKDFDKQNITFIARMFGQNLVLILSYEQDERLALWQTKLIMNEWHPAGSQSLPILWMDGRITIPSSSLLIRILMWWHPQLNTFTEKKTSLTRLRKKLLT